MGDCRAKIGIAIQLTKALSLIAFLANINVLSSVHLEARSTLLRGGRGYLHKLNSSAVIRSTWIFQVMMDTGQFYLIPKLDPKNQR